MTPCEWPPGASKLTGMKKPKKTPPAKTPQASSNNPWPRRLKALRERLGLTQVQAAERIRIAQSQWSSYEAGKRQPTRPIAHLIELLESGKI
jgi:DNA-binding transcriptional regulator YiaG